MSSSLRRGLVWGLLVSLYLRFGLEPTGWLFYEASHALSVEGLYWGYSIFRGAGYALSLWSLQNVVCALAGLMIGLWVFWRHSKKEST